MAAMSTMMLGRLISRHTPHPQISKRLFRSTMVATGFCCPDWPASMAHVRFASTRSSGDHKKAPARRPEVQRLLYQAEERYKASGGGLEPIPKITLDHVSIGYARSGGSTGQQSFNKVSTRIDMRFNVKNASWLNEKVRERIMQMEKNRINRDGEIVITSSKTRTQQGNAEDATAKLQVFNYQKKKLQAIIDAASYVPPPPSEETMKKIAELSALGEQKQLEKKKVRPQKKALRRS
ncbi:hypothetical protein CASFOL_010778 [Castilleja foliolosa]|uniref:Prokaryotic-type class I peptide chain release factors domain-containing protein n=1 Tax=Castilleja foliolosa TaxID=1961234 RepID=A0ABD3DTL5_9LAMI